MKPSVKPLVKPRIKLCFYFDMDENIKGSYWKCSLEGDVLHRFTGYGDSPREAYEDYMHWVELFNPPISTSSYKIPLSFHDLWNSLKSLLTNPKSLL